SGAMIDGETNKEYSLAKIALPDPYFSRFAFIRTGVMAGFLPKSPVFQICARDTAPRRCLSGMPS
ncbi:MAG: hypothetical protein ACREX5_06460, partial [Achromobacter pestifer]